MENHAQNLVRREVSDIPAGYGKLRVYTNYVGDTKTSELFTLASLASVLGVTDSTLLGRYRRTNLQAEVVYIPTGKSRPLRGFHLHNLERIQRILTTRGAVVAPAPGHPSEHQTTTPANVTAPVSSALEEHNGKLYFTVESLARHYGYSTSSVRNKIKAAGLLAAFESMAVPLFGGRPKKGLPKRYGQQVSALFAAPRPVQAAASLQHEVSHAGHAIRPTLPRTAIAPQDQPMPDWLRDELAAIAPQATDAEPEPTLPQQYMAPDGSIKVRMVPASVVKAERDKDEAELKLTDMLASIEAQMAKSLPVPDVAYARPAYIEELHSEESIQEQARGSMPVMKRKFMEQWRVEDAEEVLHSAKPIMGKVPELDVEAVISEWWVEWGLLAPARAEAVERSNERLEQVLSAMTELPNDDEWNDLINGILVECGVDGVMAPLPLVRDVIGKYRKRLLGATRVADRIGTNLLGKAKAEAEIKATRKARTKKK